MKHAENKIYENQPTGTPLDKLLPQLIGVRLWEIPTLIPGLISVTMLTWLSIELSNIVGESLLGWVLIFAPSKP